MDWFLDFVDEMEVNAKVATVLDSIPASSDSVKSEGRQMKQCWIMYIKTKNLKTPLIWFLGFWQADHTNIRKQL